jgi:hypothetical protein
MTKLGKMLQPLIDAEQHAPGPTPEVVAACWSRIAADFQHGTLPALDVPPPTRARNSALWLTLGLLGAGVLAAALYAFRADDPAATTDISEADIVPVLVVKPPPAPKILAPSLPVAPATEPEPVPEELPDPSPIAPVAKSRPGRPSNNAPTVDQDTFAAELRLLAEGQAALSRDDYAEALRIADLYRKTYPKGHFTEDSDALRVITLCASSARNASDAARRFLRARPRSIHAARVREACELPADPL